MSDEETEEIEWPNDVDGIHALGLAENLWEFFLSGQEHDFEFNYVHFHPMLMENEETHFQLFGAHFNQLVVDYLINQWHSDHGRTIEKIDIRFASFDEEQVMEHLVNNFMGLTIGSQLKEVWLCGGGVQRNIGRETIEAFLQSCHNLVSVERLVVADCSLTHQGRSLQGLLQNPVCAIQDLELDDCQIDNDALEGLVLGLSAHGLRFLNLSGWKLKNSQFQKVVRALVQSPNQTTLQRLNVSNNKLGIRACPILAKLVTEMSALQELCLEFNRRLFSTGRRPDEFGKKRAMYCQFFSAIGHNNNKTLSCLLMRHCGLTQDSAVPLLQALTNNSTLKTLAINSRGADLSSPFGEYLSDLKGVTTLFANLDLRIEPLRQALFRNGSITWLGVQPGGFWPTHCGAGDDYDEVHAILCRNRVLHVGMTWMEKHHNKLNSTSWPLCVEQLNKKLLNKTKKNDQDVPAATPVFSFLQANALRLVAWTSNPSHRKRPAHGATQSEFS